MFIDFLGKIFFRRHQDWQRRREVKTMLAAILVALIFSAIAVVIILVKSHYGKH
jgi:hypothetical protein